jgi:hypothetical protein
LAAVQPVIIRPVGTLPPPPLLLPLPVAAAISAVSPFSSRRTHNPSTLSALAALGPRCDWPGELAPSGLCWLLGAGRWLLGWCRVQPTYYCLLLSTSPVHARPAANGEGDRRRGLGKAHATTLPCCHLPTTLPPSHPTHHRQLSCLQSAASPLACSPHETLPLGREVGHASTRPASSSSDSDNGSTSPIHTCHATRFVACPASDQSTTLRRLSTRPASITSLRL